MKPPTLTQSQQSLIDKADFDQLFEWFNELHAGIETSMEVRRLYYYINTKMGEYKPDAN